MKTYLCYLLFLVSLFSLSCKGIVEGLNNNPSNFNDAPLDPLPNNTLLSVGAIAESHTARIANISPIQILEDLRTYIYLQE